VNKEIINFAFSSLPPSPLNFTSTTRRGKQLECKKNLQIEKFHRVQEKLLACRTVTRKINLISPTLAMCVCVCVWVDSRENIEGEIEDISCCDNTYRYVPWNRFLHIEMSVIFILHGAPSHSYLPSVVVHINLNFSLCAYSKQH
jgi:hypothetical protein